MYECSKDRMQDKISTFSKFGDADHGGITRHSLSPEAKKVKKILGNDMKTLEDRLNLMLAFQIEALL